MGIFTVTWDDSSLVTGEPLDLTDHFSTIDGVLNLGCSAIELAGYVPQWFFEAGVAHTSSNLKPTIFERCCHWPRGCVHERWMRSWGNNSSWVKASYFEGC